MILNPFKLDDASEVFEEGERLGLNKEEMIEALKTYAELKELYQPTTAVQILKYAVEKGLSSTGLTEAIKLYSCTEPSLMRALCKVPLGEVMSVIIAPRKRKIIITHPHPLEGFTNRPIHHSSGKGVISYQSYLRY